MDSSCVLHYKPCMQDIWIIQGFNRVAKVQAEIDEQTARIPLGFGTYKVVKKPRWALTRDEAEAVVMDLRGKRVDSLRRQMKALKATDG